MKHRSNSLKVGINRTWPYHLMLLPGMAILFTYTILPFLGNIIAFQDFRPIMGFTGSKWVGLEHFKAMAVIPDAARVFFNSLSNALA